MKYTGLHIGNHREALPILNSHPVKGSHIADILQKGARHRHVESQDFHPIPSCLAQEKADDSSPANDT